MRVNALQLFELLLHSLLIHIEMKHVIQRLKNFSMVIMCCTSIQVIAQDTIHISLPEAEKQFIQKNLQLLAEKYNIDIAKAAVIQAKLYANPNLSFTGDIYNPELKKLFDISNKTGEYGIALQQMVRMAGKRNKEIKLAETNTSLSENRFFDLLRTLRFSLRSTFYDMYYRQNSIAAYQSQVIALEKLNGAYEQLQAKGVVTLRDAVRIKSLLYSLKAEQASLQNELNELQASMQLLLQNNKAIFITTVDKNNIPSDKLQQLTLAGLIDTAYENRYDLKLAENNLLYSNQNYRLQKAYAKPDLNLGAEFDKRGSFVDNASFFSIAMDLPFFNRNQGNIKAAKISIDQNKVQLQQQKQTVENDVQKALAKLFNTDKMLRSVDPGFQAQFKELLEGITENFEKKNISLIEFTDFYESYKNNTLQFNQLQDEEMQAIESLHFAIGKTIFNN